MASICKGKDSWPELVGKQGKFAEETIEKENPNVNAEIVLEGTGVTEDFRCDRVWVWVDGYGTVTRVPVIGKSSWPELVGKQGKEAEEIIERENPLVDAVIIDPNTSYLPVVLCDRVLVWVNSSGIVYRVPTIG
ncbi:hypothetical protein FEM48_Zijuj07G0109400 [Ziziphus jujuba var. spinosa]|uniref:Proteinase inhibitor n=1 Tax=Ziziphus jujuba var. spinosa TaxID=714518 RepID=A0A978V483_ZIZJJ|nr:hypothetical protein FEM48_Zijuj07G0109400 [Ziziphus jujuba var. spinosa]